jgi:hypothetical protein
MHRRQQKNYKFEIIEMPKKTRKLGTEPSEVFEAIEKRLLLGSIPLYFVVILLVIIASTFASVPWVALPAHLVISFLSVLIALVLLIKWVTTLRHLCARALADRSSEEAIAVAIGAACVCLLLAGLTVLVATNANALSAPLLILLVILPIMLIWQYRHIISGA